MPIPKKTIRSLQNIRTLSGKRDRSDTTYKVYMRLSTLEMEKVRLENKRQSALVRIKEIDARMQQIETEERSLRSELGLLVEDIPPNTSESVEEIEAAPVKEVEKPSRGFRIRY